MCVYIYIDIHTYWYININLYICFYYLYVTSWHLFSTVNLMFVYFCLVVRVLVDGWPWNTSEQIGTPWNKLDQKHRWHGPQPSDDWSFPSDAHWRWGRWRRRRRPGENRARWHDDTTCGATCDNCDNHNQVAVILYDSRWTEHFAPLAHSKITIATVPAEA